MPEDTAESIPSRARLLRMRCSCASYDGAATAGALLVHRHIQYLNPLLCQAHQADNGQGRCSKRGDKMLHLGPDAIHGLIAAISDS